MHMRLSWLDFKLGFRMLSRYPMLTVVGSLAMAVAIGVGAGTFEVITRLTAPSLPLPGGDRIVALNYWDRAQSGGRPASALTHCRSGSPCRCVARYATSGVTYRQ